ncbi:MAG: A/G-specific adenine glycosylase [Clostridia bacterium]|nr:A/G-specific adenine glycosylase [Clostridia bacterium]
MRSAVPALLDWYAAHRRPLPFRETPTPYRVWVSEIMLQQTRIETALPYFERFMQTFPTVQALADADEERLFKLWEGLGYYSRARNLQKAAKQTMERYGGELPASYDDLLSLSGIGEYTAGAIASIAYGLPVPAVDGNVLRVFARLTACDGDVLAPAVRKELRGVVEAVLPAETPGAFNEAVMELGETVCLPGAAVRCEQCPLTEVCEANKRGCAEALPVRKAPKPRRAETRTVAVIITDEPTPRVLLHRRGDGLLARMWELPNTEGALSPEQVAALWSLTPKDTEILPDGKHVFSHVQWNLHGVRLTVAPFPAPDGCVWVTAEELQAYALPRAFSLYAGQLPKWMTSRR